MILYHFMHFLKMGIVNKYTSAVCRTGRKRKSAEQLKGDAGLFKHMGKEMRRSGFVKIGLILHSDHFVFGAGSALIGQNIDAHKG